MTNRELNFIFCLLLVIISSVISLVMVEFYLRIFRPQSIVPRYVEDSEYGIRKNIANVRGFMSTPEYKHKFNTNSKGFRGGKEYLRVKHPNTYRIIVLGDSVALGHGVEDNETFCEIMERNLSDIRPTEVINMGVSGFGTAEELIQLCNIGFRYNPDLIILSYFPNDPYNNLISKLFKIEKGRLIRDQTSFTPALSIRDNLYRIPGYSFLSQHSHLLNFFRSYFSGLYIKKLGNEYNLTTTTPVVLSEHEAQLTTLLINEIISEVGKYHIPLYILNIPAASNGSCYSNFPLNLIKINRYVTLVDVKEQVYSGYSLNKLFYKNDGHPTPLGHKLIGDYTGYLIKTKIWQISSS